MSHSYCPGGGPGDTRQACESHSLVRRGTWLASVCILEAGQPPRPCWIPRSSPAGEEGASWVTCPHQLHYKDIPAPTGASLKEWGCLLRSLTKPTVTDWELLSSLHPDT